jgi:hypothetical protein
MGLVFPIRVINRFSAIMFAASRIAKVHGRIIFLIVSMHTMNIFSTLGFPCCTRWISMWFAFLIHLNIMNPVQRGTVSGNVSITGLFLVKMYGNSPNRLLNMIMENKGINMNVHPFLFLLCFRRVLNSSCSLFVRSFHIIVRRDGINHIPVGNISVPMIVLVQFSFKFRMPVDGSITDNRFLIIFCLVF